MKFNLQSGLSKTTGTYPYHVESTSSEKFILSKLSMVIQYMG